MSLVERIENGRVVLEYAEQEEPQQRSLADFLCKAGELYETDTDRALYCYLLYSVDEALSGVPKRTDLSGYVGDWYELILAEINATITKYPEENVMHELLQRANQKEIAIDGPNWIQLCAREGDEVIKRGEYEYKACLVEKGETGYFLETKTNGKGKVRFGYARFLTVRLEDLVVYGEMQRRFMRKRKECFYSQDFKPSEMPRPLRYGDIVRYKGEDVCRELVSIPDGTRGLVVSASLSKLSVLWKNQPGLLQRSAGDDLTSYEAITLLKYNPVDMEQAYGDWLEG